ncbi:hypothetical protein HRbin32_02046 [bacterium HR32]|nr:hypothetical protein HRbin32_02046 [bacterium HR32]
MGSGPHDTHREQDRQRPQHHPQGRAGPVEERQHEERRHPKEPGDLRAAREDGDGDSGHRPQGDGCDRKAPLHVGQRQDARRHHHRHEHQKPALGPSEEEHGEVGGSEEQVQVPQAVTQVRRRGGLPCGHGLRLHAKGRPEQGQVQGGLHRPPRRKPREEPQGTPPARLPGCHQPGDHQRHRVHVRFVPKQQAEPHARSRHEHPSRADRPLEARAPGRVRTCGEQRHGREVVPRGGCVQRDWGGEEQQRRSCPTPAGLQLFCA